MKKPTMNHKERIKVINKLSSKKKLSKKEIEQLAKAITGEVMLRLKRKARGF